MVVWVFSRWPRWDGSVDVGLGGIGLSTLHRNDAVSDTPCSQHFKRQSRLCEKPCLFRHDGVKGAMLYGGVWGKAPQKQFQQAASISIWRILR